MALGKAGQPWGPCPTLGLDSCGTCTPTRVQEHPASLVSTPMGSATRQPRALSLRVLTLPTQDSWATDSRDSVTCPGPPRVCITHKSLPSSTARLIPTSQTSEPRLGDEPHRRQGPHSSDRPCGAEPLPHSQPGSRAGGGVAAATRLHRCLHHSLGSTWFIKPAGWRETTITRGGVSSAQTSYGVWGPSGQRLAGPNQPGAGSARAPCCPSTDRPALGVPRGATLCDKRLCHGWDENPLSVCPDEMGL